MKILSNNVKAILAFSIIFLGFAYFFATTFSGVNADPQIIIAIVALMGSASSYYFGNSSGSAKKDEIIQQNIESK